MESLDKSKGYVSVHRSIENHWLWEDKPFSKGQAWIDLIMMAKHKSEKFPYKDSVIEGKRGTVYRSISSISERWGWGREKTTRFLRQLESDGMVQLNTTTHHTTVTLVNYGVYQVGHTTNHTANRQQIDSKSTANRQQTDTYNNVNNVNNDKKIEPSADSPTEKEPDNDPDDWWNKMEWDD